MDISCLMRAVCLLILFCSAAGALGAETTAAQAEFFEIKIRPLLAEHCYRCHGPDRQQGKLRLDQQTTMLAGGESGPAVVPGNPAESLLVEAINYDGLEMPPDGKLNQGKIDILTEWIRQGAHWPGSDPTSVTVAVRQGIAVTEEDRQWWSFQPIKRYPVPVVSHWTAQAKHPIDAFIHDALAEQSLTPNPPASPTQLLRRAFFDLWGLPPTPGESARYLASDRPDRYARLLDRLLSSPNYGERWGRHWLDVVRFGETNGYERDSDKPLAWQYRDYVIRSFNQDKPYDIFLREQLAGDELDHVTDDGLIATGFYRLGVWDDEPDDLLVGYYEELDDIVRVTCNTMLGLTIGCARCHDHKFDPIPQHDYYRMVAFFRNVKSYGRPWKPTHLEFNPDASFTPLRKNHSGVDWEQVKQRIRNDMNQAKAKLAELLLNARRRVEAKQTSAGIAELATAFRTRQTDRSPTEQELIQTAEQTAISTNGLAMWLDASDPDGDGDPSNHPPDGTPVNVWPSGKWVDKSGADNHANVAAHPVQAPTWIEYADDGEWGPHTVRFHGTQTGLLTPLYAHATMGNHPTPQLTVVVVAKSRSDASYRSLWTFDGTTGGNHRGFGVLEQQFVAQAGGALLQNKQSTDVWRITTVTYDYPHNCHLDVNGQIVSLGTKEGPTAHDHPMAIGYFPTSTPPGAQFLNGDIAELLVYRRLLNKQEQQKLQDYLAAKYGLTTDLVEATLDGKLTPEESAKRNRIRETIDKLKAESKLAHPKALSVREAGIEAEPTHVLIRGNPRQTGELVEPITLSVLGGEHLRIVPSNVPAWLQPYEVQPTSGRRRALADWITRPDHPLTARVIVNRLWHYHFGAGLVPTPSDFGRRGLPPSHPRLLDFLASDLVAGGWQLKRIQRWMMTSATYRQSSRVHPGSQLAITNDPQNRMLWRQNMRRLEAEPMRDSMLQISGQLNRKMGGSSVYPTLPTEILSTQSQPGNGWTPSSTGEQVRRSIYVVVKRALRIPLLETFDAPSPDKPEPTRATTTVSPQALMLLNDQFIDEQAASFAQRLLDESPESDEARVQWAYRLTLNRSPQVDEQLTALDYMAWQSDTWSKLQASEGQSTTPEDANKFALKALCKMLYNLNEFVYVD